MKYGKRYGATQLETTRQIWLFTQLKDTLRNQERFCGAEMSLSIRMETVLNHTPPPPPSSPGWRRRPHQLTSFQSFFVAVEADPGAEDDGAHKVDVAHELDGRRHAGDDASVQIKGQRDGFHGDDHL